MPAAQSPEGRLPTYGWTKAQWTVVALFCSIAFIAYVQRLSISVTVLPVRVEFGLGIRQGTWLLAAFSWGYAVAQIPSGWLTDYWGARRTLALAAFVWSSALGLLTISSGFAASWTLWCLVGVAQSCAFSCATRGLHSWLPVSTWARANGGLTGAMSLGGGVTTALTAVLLTAMPWRDVYALYAAIGVVWALLFWLLFRDEPDADPTDGDRQSCRSANLGRYETNESAILATSTGQILRMPAVWALMAQQFFRCAPYVFFASLFPMFLQQHRGMNLRDSGLLSSLPLFGTLLGCLVSGLLADRLLNRYGTQLASRRAIAVTGLSLTVMSILTAMWFTNPLVGTLVMCVGTFGSAFAGVAAFTAAMDVGQHRVGTVFGLMNTAGNVAGAISPIIAGEIIVRFGNWNIIVALCAGLYLASIASWVILGSTNPAPLIQDVVGTAPKILPPNELATIPLESGNASC